MLKKFPLVFIAAIIFASCSKNQNRSAVSPQEQARAERERCLAAWGAGLQSSRSPNFFVQLAEGGRARAAANCP
jgi:hypothetical protein